MIKSTSSSSINNRSTRSCSIIFLKLLQISSSSISFTNLVIIIHFLQADLVQGCHNNFVLSFHCFHYFSFNIYFKILNEVRNNDHIGYAVLRLLLDLKNVLLDNIYLVHFDLAHKVIHQNQILLHQHNMIKISRG